MSSWDDYKKEGIDYAGKDEEGRYKLVVASTATTKSFNASGSTASFNIDDAAIQKLDSVALGSGDDKVTGSTAVGKSLDMGDGNNIVEFQVFNDGTINAGKGDDEVAIGYLDPTTVNLGDGNNKAFVTSSIDSTIIGGSGRDSFKVESVMSGGVINAAGGSDSINIDGAYVKESTIYAGDGADYVTLAGGGQDALVDLGADNDIIFIDGTTSYTDVSVTGGTGKDTFVVGKDASGVVITDFDVDEDVLVFSSVTAKAGDLKFKANGVISDSNDSVAIAKNNGYYAAKVSITGGEQIVAWASEDGAVIDGGDKTKSLYLYGNTNEDVADTLIGGSKSDSIVTGEGDVAFGGAGRDSILFTANNAREYVALNTESGKDSVTGFKTKSDATSADDADVVYLFNDSLDSLRISTSSGSNVLVKDGSASVELLDVKASGDVKLNVMDNSGTITEVDYVLGEADIDADPDDMSGVYYSGDKKNAALNFNKVDSALVVDLDSRGMAGLTNTNNTIYYGKFNTVKGGSDDTVLMGSADNKETLVAGSGDTTLWGGGSKADSLSHTSGTNSVVFYYGVGDGKDSVNSINWGNDDEDDILWLSDDASVTKVKGNGTTATITLADTADKLTISGLGTNQVIKFSNDGQTVQKAKIGSSSNNNWTYAQDINFYVGGKNNTLNVYDDVDTAAIWLDSEHGVTYEGVKTVNASSNDGSLLIGGSSSNESLVAGKGNTTLWGGAGNDTLVGNSTGTTEFYFGKGNGKDVISKSNADDKVVLFDVALSDVADATYNAGTMKLSLTDGSTLTVQNMSSSSVNTFQLSDGSKWTFDTSSKSWTQA